MNGYFLRSGFGKIYHYLEQAIHSAFYKLDLPVRFDAQTPFAEKSLLNTWKKEKPDFIFTLTGYNMSEALLHWIKSNEIPLIVWLTEDPYMLDRSLSLLPFASYVFTIEQEAVLYYRELGHSRSYFLPLGVNPDIYKPRPYQLEHQSDICFVGYPYQSRIELIRFLASELNASILVIGPWEGSHSPKRFKLRPNG